MAERRVLSLIDILTWKDYYAANVKSLNQLRPDAALSKSLFAGSFPPFPPDDEINTKVSIHEGDITDLEIDGIVNAANSSLLGGGGVDGAIHSAAGSQLLEECRTLCGCQTGDAKTTCGYRLPAKHVIHTVGPQGIYPKDLRSCYGRCLEEMMANNMRTLAFPCISTGIYGYPNDLAVHVALNTVREWLDELKKKDKLHLLDRVIFSLWDEDDAREYKIWMQYYFPVPDSDRADSKAHDKPNYQSVPALNAQLSAVQPPAVLPPAVLPPAVLPPAVQPPAVQPPAVQQSPVSHVRLLLPASVLGTIIGSGGENLQRLKTDFKASTMLLRGKGPERILTVDGTFGEICGVIMDVSRSISYKTYDGEEEKDIELRILFNKTNVDFISSNLLRLSTNTATQIRTYVNCTPYSTERVIEIKGKPTQIGGAVKSILKLLQGVPLIGANVPYNPNNFDQFNSTSYGGYTDDGSGHQGSSGSGPVRATSGIYGLENGGMTACEVCLSKKAAEAFTSHQHINLVEQASGAGINLVSFQGGDYKLFVNGTQGQCQYAHYLLHLQLLRHARSST